MRVEKLTVSLTALLVATTCGVFAAQQSMLDPYSNIKPPSVRELKERQEKQSQKAAGKHKTLKSAHKSMSDQPSASTAEKPSGQPGGFMTGTRQVFHGIGTATRGAAGDLVHPVKTLGSGITSGGRKIGDTVIGGAKASGGTLAKGVEKVGSGVKVAGEKVKDSTQAAGKVVTGVPGKFGEGLKAAADKVKEGGQKLAAGTAAAGSKVKEATGGIGERLIAMPKTVGHGVVLAAGKTGDATKKVAAAPLHIASRLNPFHHKKDDAPVQTAGAPAVEK